MSKNNAQAFFEKKKEKAKGEVKRRRRNKDEDIKYEKSDRDTSKMPEGLRKHFEKKGKK